MVKSNKLMHPPGQQSPNGKSTIATMGAYPYQRMENSLHTLQSVPSPFGTRRHTQRSVESNTLEAYIQLHSHQTIAVSRLLEMTGNLPSKIVQISCFHPILLYVLCMVGLYHMELIGLSLRHRSLTLVILHSSPGNGPARRHRSIIDCINHQF